EEDIYLDLLERFATDKQKADMLKAKRIKDQDGAEAIEEEEVVKVHDESAYMQVLKQSIVDGVEALAKSKDEPPVPRKPKRVIKKKEEPPKVVEKEEIKVPIEKEASKKTTIAEKPEPAIDKETKEDKKVEAVAKEKEKAEPVTQPVTPEVDEDKTGKGKKAKFKPEKTKVFEEESGLSEKEKKRRKAMEMIRKDKDVKRSGKIDLSRLGEDGGKRRAKPKKPKRKEVDLKEVQDTVKKTLASIEARGKKPKKHRRIKTEDGEIIEEKVIKVTEFISANDLANLMDVSVSEIITKCLELGLVVSINQRLDLDTIQLLAEEYGYAIEESEVTEFVDEEFDEEEDDEASLEPRAPIVTIMGHVDHGKTSLLDHLRQSHIVDGEAGGITQHIGAYEVDYQDKKITFLDTPGHEAFTAMRARGAQVTDVVILIIAADDAVMPQTVEALDHAKAAGVKIVIAINKIDKPGADPEKIKQQLADRDILVEDWGGTYQCAEISAKKGEGIDDLLEKVLLEAEMLDVKANPKKLAAGFVIESRLDKGKGAIATVLIQNGTLKVGDNFVAGSYHGKVRALLNEKEERLSKVGPAQPALVVGFIGVAQAGDRFMVTRDEKTAREISNRRLQLKREQDAKQHKLKTLSQISEQIKSGGVSELPILVKADVDGSAEALADSLISLNTSEVKVQIIRKAVGPISESDVLLASASNAVIIGFHVRANAKARELAITEEVDIRLYQVIYDAINDIKLALEGMLAPTVEENIVGQAEVRDTFKISRLGVIAGCYVISGKILRNNKVRLIRDDVEVYKGNIASLKRFKDDAREVASGFECGIQIEGYNDLRVGDIIESYEISEVKRQLA
ncbi:MAG TPA: translation initiation factor IF-2, partial [Caldithrix sp.]|nr:translation initiation factor IF-2 [Caldithrix sp.]